MIIKCTILVLIYIFAMLIIGQININHKEKTEFFIVSSVAYNAFMGYSLPTIYKLAKLYFSDIPKGALGERVIPILETWFNMFTGTFITAMYFACLIPINIYMCSKSKMRPSYYININIIAGIAGALVFYLLKK